jgi:peptide/nickel transport system permease protein
VKQAVATTDARLALVQRVGRATRRDGLLRAGAVLLLLIVAAGLLAPVLTPYDPVAQSPRETLLPPGSPGHILGTDQFGRDIYTRCLYAIRLDLFIGVVGVALPLILGTILGALAGYLRGWPEILIMRTLDVVTAFPYLVILIALVAVLGPSLVNLFLALTLSGWTTYARLVRGEMLTVREHEYVLAAEGLGLPSGQVLARHLLPNAISPALVFAMADVVLTILFAASLSFLGLGVQPPTAEWGQMIHEGQSFILGAWWLVTFPGLFIVATGVALSMLGDGLADRIRGEA